MADLINSSIEVVVNASKCTFCDEMNGVTVHCEYLQIPTLAWNLEGGVSLKLPALCQFKRAAQTHSARGFHRLSVYLILSLLLHRHFSPTTLPLTLGTQYSVRIVLDCLARSPRPICNLETVTAYRYALSDRPDVPSTPRTQRNRLLCAASLQPLSEGRKGFYQARERHIFSAPACVSVHSGKRGVLSAAVAVE